MRPAFKACCGEFTGVSEYYEQAEFDEGADLTDGDFRGAPFALNDKEAAPGKQSMRQIHAQAVSAPAWDDPEQPPKIQPSLPVLDFDDEDVIEGLEYLDPIPPTDTSLALDLSLNDPRRPLPEQVGKWISDTLGSIFKACSIGGFETVSSGSCEDETGRMVCTDVGFEVAIKGDSQPAVELIRETLWWVGAPADTNLDDLELSLSQPPVSTASRFLQFAVPKVVRWQIAGEPGHRLDRLPFSTAQREAVRRILADARAAVPTSGWVELPTRDGGRLAVYLKYLNDSADFDTLNLLVEALTPEVSGLIHRLMHECALMLLPMAFAATAEVAQAIDCDWPSVEVVETAAALHELLARGPHHWWRCR